MNTLINTPILVPYYGVAGHLSLCGWIFLYATFLAVLFFIIPVIYQIVPELIDDYRNMFADIKERIDRRSEKNLACERRKHQIERDSAFDSLVQLAISQREEWRDKTLTFCDIKVGDLICMKYGDIDEIFQLEKITLYSDGCIDQFLFRGLYSGIYGFNFWSLRTDKDPRQHIESYMIIRTK